MKAATRRLVQRRAANRCEYCRIHQDDDFLYPFHIEHIIARKHGGEDDPANLAWSCHHCNLAKGSNLAGWERQTGRIVALFHPRWQKWGRHFFWAGPRIAGKSRIGRATIRVLNLNAPKRIALRKVLIAAGVFPPP